VNGGLWRLDVVVVVEHQRPGACAAEPSQDDGVAGGGDGLGAGAGMLQGAVHQAGHLGHAGALGGDAGLAAEGLEKLDGRVEMAIDVAQDVIHVRPSAVP
jgi:hypothetical protein